MPFTLGQAQGERPLIATGLIEVAIARQRQEGFALGRRRHAGDNARGLAMSSTKSATGHLLGAAGAIEAIFSILAIRDGVAPPTLNLDEPSVPSVIDRVANTAQQRPIKVALSNSFGFGGTNASVIFRAAA